MWHKRRSMGFGQTTLIFIVPKTDFYGSTGSFFQLSLSFKKTMMTWLGRDNDELLGRSY